MIEHVSTSSRSGFFQRSHIPANAKTESSARVKQKGDCPLLNFESSRGPTLRLVPPLRTVHESFQLTRLKFPGTLKS